MPKVYITQQPMKRDIKTGELIPLYDVTPALEYGNIVHLCKPGPMWHAPTRLVHTLKRALKHYTSDDYLLLLGDPVLMITAAIVAAQRTQGTINVLRWDRHYKKYIAVTIKV
jgi:hypothetical protein